MNFPSFTFLVSLSFFATSSAAAIDKPALILVPGAFHRASVYHEVRDQLSDVGYDHIDTVDLPSNGYDVVDIERTVDINAVKMLLEARLKVNEDVVLIGNSYGATVIMEAVKDFEDRSIFATSEIEIGHGRILGLIMVSYAYLTCVHSNRLQLSGYIPTIAEVNQSPPRPDIRIVGAPFFNYQGPPNSAPETVTWDSDLAAYPPSLTFYNLLNASSAEYWTSQLLPSSFKALNATGTYIPYDGKFRTLYVVGEHDNSVSPAFAQNYIDQEGAKFEVEVIDGDHVPMLSRPKAVVDVIRRFVGETVVNEDGQESLVRSDEL